MAGLLSMTPETGQALALLGAGMARGDFGGGLLAASQYAGGMKQRQMEEQLAQMRMQEAQMRMAEMQREQAMQQKMQEAAKASLITPEKAYSLSLGPNIDGSAPPMVNPGLDTRAFLNRMYEIEPLKAMGLEQSLNKTEEPIKLGAGESLYDRKTFRPLVSAPVKPPEAPSAVREYEYARGQGYQGTFEQWDRERKRAGASTVSVKVDNKMGESLAGQVGPMVKDSRVQTDGAVKMFDAANRIELALNSNKVLAGPGASQIQTVRQFTQMVGGGNDEGIRQTRQVIKSLAQMAVEARKQLQGQGQVTESEAAAVARADAGDINDLTIGELRDLVALTKRAAHYTAKGHSDILKELNSNPGTAGLVPFYRVQRMDELLKHEPKLPQIGPQPSVEDLLKKYGGR